MEEFKRENSAMFTSIKHLQMTNTNLQTFRSSFWKTYNKKLEMKKAFEKG